MQQKITILNHLFQKILKYILFCYFIFLYKKFYARENINKTIILDNKIFYKKQYNNIQDIIKYQADIIKYDLYNNKSYLIGNAKIYYNDIFIQAQYIEINWKTNNIYANYQFNKLIYQPKKILIIYNNKEYYCDNFFFNLKTQIGIGNNLFYEEKRGVIVAKSIKKKQKNIVFMNEAFYTHDNYFKNKKDYLSDYFLKTKFIKNINNQFIITGPILMYLYQIPTPILLPFLYLSTNNKHNFRILIPHIGRNNNNELFIENLGFFSPITNYWDIKVAGSMYYKSSWQIYIKTKYNFIYDSLGKIQLNYQNFFNNKGKSHNNIYEMIWDHITKNKTNAFMLFVNFHTRKYQENIINNSLSANIYSMKFKKYFVKFPLTFIINNNLNHNFYKKTITMYLPKITLLIDNINPLQKMSNTFFKNCNINYNMNINNILYYNDKHVFKNKMLKIINTTFEQHLLINTKTEILKYFRIIPNIIYNDKKIFIIDKNDNFFLNNRLKKLIQLKLDINLLFTLYGIKKFPKNTFIKALRHKIDTKIIYSYYPTDIQNYNNHFLYNDIKNFNIAKKIKFLFSNNIQAKVNTKNYNYQKINLIDHLDIYTTYDISKKVWNDIIFHGNTMIKNFLVDISGRVYINENSNINFLSKIINNNFLRICTIKYWSLAVGYKVDNYIFSKEKNIYKKKGQIRYENFFYDDYNYAHYNIFLNFNVNLHYNYHNDLSTNIIDKSLLLTLYGNIYPTPFWKIGINLNYDIINKKIIHAFLLFHRDLRSFKIKFICNTNNTYYLYLGMNYNLLNK